MRHLATLAFLVAAGNAAAYDQGVNYWLSLDSATGNTRVDYVITNEWATEAGHQVVQQNLAAWYSLGAPVSASFSSPTPGTPGWSGSLGSPNVTFAANMPSLTAVNVETNATKNVTGFALSEFTFNGNTYVNLGFTFGGGGVSDPGPPVVYDGLAMSSGQHVRIEGSRAGSFILAKSFSFFNQGQWINGSYSNVTIGSAPAVPEPSTYGLALGGLALAVVAVRRRKVSK